MCLIGPGIGPEDLVALCLPPCLPDLVARRCWRCSRPGAATCRWISITRRAPRPPCWTTPGRAAVFFSRAGGSGAGLPRHRRTAGARRRRDPDGALDGSRATPIPGDRDRRCASLFRCIRLTSSTPPAPTGLPKGVVVSHHNTVRLFEATQPWFNFGAGEVWTPFHAYTFDFSVWELWGLLLARRPAGGRAVPDQPGARRIPPAPGAEGVTVLNQTPAAFYQLQQADRENAELAACLRARHLRRRGAGAWTAWRTGTAAMRKTRRSWSTCTGSPRPPST